MTHRATHNGGWALMELVLVVILLSALMFAMLEVLDISEQANRQQLILQRCTAAAQAMIDSIDANDKIVDPKDINRLWSDVVVDVKRSPGVGQWSGLTLVEVTAVAPFRKSAVKIKLSRYIEPPVRRGAP